MLSCVLVAFITHRASHAVPLPTKRGVGLVALVIFGASLVVAVLPLSGATKPFAYVDVLCCAPRANSNPRQISTMLLSNG